MTPADLERLIDEKIAVARMDGWQICDGCYFVQSMMRCCALSACVLPELARNEDAAWGTRTDCASVIQKSLGLSDQERYSFTDAFDDTEMLGHHIPEFYDLGVRMRAKYIEAK